MEGLGCHNCDKMDAGDLLQKLYETGDQHDLLLESSDGTCVSCNRFVLVSSLGDVFQSMLTGAFKEATMDKVSLKQFNAGTLRAVVEYAYLKRCSDLDMKKRPADDSTFAVVISKVDIALGVLHAGKFFLLAGLSTLARSFLDKAMQELQLPCAFRVFDGCHQEALLTVDGEPAPLWKDATLKMDESDLYVQLAGDAMNIIWQGIDKTTDDWETLNYFKGLTRSAVGFILADPDLYVNEYYVFQLVDQWMDGEGASASVEERKEIGNLVKLEGISPCILREEVMEVDWISNAAVYEAWFHQATKISKLYEFNFTEVRRGWFDHTAGRAPTRIKVGGTGTVFDGEYFATRVFGNIQYHLDGEIEVTLPPIGVVCDGKTILCKTRDNKWWAFRTLRKSTWHQYNQFKCEMKHKNELLPVRGTKWVKGESNNVNCVGTGFEPIIQCRFD